MFIVLAVVAVIPSLALLVVIRSLGEAHRAAQKQWAEERRELLNRIQAPERSAFVSPDAATYELPDETPDEFNLVGSLVNDPEMYLKADDA